MPSLPFDVYEVVLAFSIQLALDGADLRLGHHRSAKVLHWYQQIAIVHSSFRIIASALLHDHAKLVVSKVAALPSSFAELKHAEYRAYWPQISAHGQDDAGQRAFATILAKASLESAAIRCAAKRSLSSSCSLLPPFEVPIVDELIRALGRCTSLRHLALHGFDQANLTKILPSISLLQLDSLRLDLYCDRDGRPQSSARVDAQLRVRSLELGLDASTPLTFGDQVSQLFVSATIEQLMVHLGGSSAHLPVQIARRLLLKHKNTLKAVKIDNRQTTYAFGPVLNGREPVWESEESIEFKELRKLEINGMRFDPQAFTSKVPLQIIEPSFYEKFWSVNDKRCIL